MELIHPVKNFRSPYKERFFSKLLSLVTFRVLKSINLIKIKELLIRRTYIAYLRTHIQGPDFYSQIYWCKYKTHQN